MKRTLVTTTINVPTVIEQWVATGMNEEDEVIVVGDLKTPHTEVKRFLDTLTVPSVYIDPREKTGFHIEEATGYNVIQRRNLGFLAAMVHPIRPDVIITMDDDNAPTRDWVTHVTTVLTQPNTSRVIASPSGWWNPGTLCGPVITHRGYPMRERHKEDTSTERETGGEMVGVFQSLVMGDPDIDAVERLVNNPKVDYVRTTRTVEKGTWMPFNSQATAFRSELMPLMLMWPGVGRYDDIWASYFVQAVMQPLGYHVQVGLPAVRQRRNEHDVLKDLSDEFYGYVNTPVVAAALRGIMGGAERLLEENAREILDAPISVSAIAAYRTLSKVLGATDKLPPATIAAFDAWCEDVELVFGV